MRAAAHTSSPRYDLAQVLPPQTEHANHRRTHGPSKPLKDPKTRIKPMGKRGCRRHSNNGSRRSTPNVLSAARRLPPVNFDRGHHHDSSIFSMKSTLAPSRLSMEATAATGDTRFDYPLLPKQQRGATTTTDSIPSTAARPATQQRSP